MTISYGQSSITDSSINIPLLKLGYSANFPGKDLKDRFGFTSSLNARFEIKLKSQWIVGVKYDFLFGGNVSDSGMLKELITSSGGIIGVDGKFSTYEMLQRGHHIGVYLGRLLPYLSTNPNSGFVITAGVGLLTHKINFNNINNDIIQLNGIYKGGYDRYTSGISFTEFIGYRYMSNNKLMNFYCGIEFTQAFTKLRRDKLMNFYCGIEFTQAFTKLRRDYQVDYEINDPRFGMRNDNLFNIQVGWILPIYSRVPKEFYY